MFGKEYADKSWKPEPEEAFHAINWNEENVRKYYNFAFTVATEARERIERERGKIEKKRNRDETISEDDERLQRFDEAVSKAAWEAYQNKYVVKIEDLPNYEKSPPQYKEHIFQKTFPEALKTPAYKTWIGGALGVLIVFLPCYAGLHLISFITKWLINKFIIGNILKRLDMISGGMAYIIIKTLVFCIGVGFIVNSYSPAFDSSHDPHALSRYAEGAFIKPLPFALGLAICIVSGVVLLKAVRDYLK
jgi:hypothetical protein